MRRHQCRCCDLKCETASPLGPPSARWFQPCLTSPLMIKALCTRTWRGCAVVGPSCPPSSIYYNCCDHRRGHWFIQPSVFLSPDWMLNNSKEVQLPTLEKEVVVPSANIPSALLLSVPRQQEQHLFQVWLQSSLKTVFFHVQKVVFLGITLQLSVTICAPDVCTHTYPKKKDFTAFMSVGKMVHVDNQLNSYFTCAVTPVSPQNILCQMILLFLIHSFSCFYKTCLLQI